MKAKVLPERVLRCMSPEDRKRCGVKTAAESAADLDAKSEAQIQKLVEAYCRQRGFEPLTTENIQRAEVRKDFPPAGWQYHLSQMGVKRNPMLPDITLFDRSGRFLWLELKAPGGAVRPLQAVMIKLGFWKIAYSPEEAAVVINEWLEQAYVTGDLPGKER